MKPTFQGDADEMIRAVHETTTAAQLDALVWYWRAHGIAISVTVGAWVWLARMAMKQ